MNEQLTRQQLLLDAQNLSFAYENEGEAPKQVLIDLSMAVRPGEMVAVLGHNGSGKSTLAKHFNAILLPEGGVCYVDGMDTREEDHLLDIRQQVGMVFQNPDNQIVATIVEEDVAFGPENLGIPPQEIRERVDDALESVGMSAFKLHAPHQLSGGQKQRIAIAGVIAMRPRCLVLDEPTAMLDPRGRREVMKTIRRLNREFGITVVHITHYMDEAAQCDRVVVVDQGHLLLDGSPNRVFSHVQQLKEIGLDVPQVTDLLFELRQAGLDLPEDCIDETQGADRIAALLDRAGVERSPR